MDRWTILVTACDSILRKCRAVPLEAEIFTNNHGERVASIIEHQRWGIGDTSCVDAAGQREFMRGFHQHVLYYVSECDFDHGELPERIEYTYSPDFVRACIRYWFAYSVASKGDMTGYL